VVVEGDEGDEEVSEDERWWRGGATMAKSGGGSSSSRERRRARESSGARGEGAGCFRECSSPFIGVGRASVRRQQTVNGDD
jgi:hypothetical protein